jgi:nucleotide-binding universal stress UspA family protein
MDAPFIVGFDGSAASADAVRLTVRLAAGAGAPVIAAHAFLPGRDIAAERAAADELLEQLGETGVRLRSIAAHSAAEGLRDVARYEGAALLAVARTHHGPVGRALANSVPDQLLHSAPCPVLVVPPGHRGPTGVIGVAFDGGDSSRSALAVARELARDSGARVVLLAVATLPVGLPFDPLAYSDFECRALHGPPGFALAAASASGVDLLVAGSRGYGPLHAVVAGSVSRHLAHHAACPVLVVPRGARDRLGASRPLAGVVAMR